MTGRYISHISTENIQSIADSAWWQLLIVIITALLTQLFGYVFVMRRKRKQKIVITCSNLVANLRTFRHGYHAFIEHDINFIDQQKHVKEAIKRGDDKAFEIHKDAAFHAQKTALHFAEQMMQSQSKVIELSFALTGIHNERFANEKNFYDAINNIETSMTDDRDNLVALKKQIDEKIIPSMVIIEALCHKIINEESRSLWQQLKHFMSFNNE